MKSECTHLPTTATWDVVIIKDFEGIESIRSIWEQMQNKEPFPAPNADIDRYLASLNETSDNARPHIILFKHEDHPAAMIIGRIERYKITLKFGYLSFHCPRAKCFRVVYGGILGQPDVELCSLLIEELLQQIRQRQFDIISFNHLRTNTPLYQVIRRIPGLFTRDHFPKIDEHWRMTVPEKIEQFYSSHSHGHRHNLRRAIRKFDKECLGESKIINYSTQNDVDDFIRVATDISSKTYQSKLGVGLVNDEKTRSRLVAAATKGWFQGHILFSGDTPCAFQLASRYRRTYYMESIGYDPALNSYKPGLILFLKVLEFLCNDPSVNVIDFYFGDAEYKHRYGTEHWSEVYIHMFAPRPCPIFINTLRSSTMAMNLGIKYIANMFCSADRIKRKWRHLLQARS